jgi:hypothetical protein
MDINNLIILVLISSDLMHEPWIGSRCDPEVSSFFPILIEAPFSRLVGEGAPKGRMRVVMVTKYFRQFHFAKPSSALRAPSPRGEKGASIRIGKK